tara:strand:+ start:151 stop:723 length:573 start_codon:yes stop_codon:yes gene_type:complete
MRKIAILISGRGSNMEAILKNIHDGRLIAEVAIVISNKPTARGLQLAVLNDIDTRVFDPKSYSDRDHYETDLVACLQSYNVDLVVLAGYMKLVGDPMLTAFNGRMINIHPSLLPSFKGLHAQRQALDYGVKITGCTVHHVTKEMDSGPIILQAAVPVFKDDTLESLTARILEKEHDIFSKAIQLTLDDLN